MKKPGDGDPPFPNAQLPTMQIDALDPAQDVSLEDADVGVVASEGPPRSRATPPPLPPEASVPPLPVASTPSAPPPAFVAAAPAKSSLSPVLLLVAALGVMIVGGGIVALVVRGSPAPQPPAVSVVQTAAPAPTPPASATSSAGVMTIPVIEFDDTKK